MKRNFEKAREEGSRIVAMHPQMDLRASELRFLVAKYSREDISESIYYAITDLWYAGLAAGYRMGQRDAKNQIESK